MVTNRRSLRIVITADLHYQPSTRAVYEDFAAWVEEQQPDCFIVAGDVGHPLRLFRRGLQFFAGLSCPRLLIAGNHDVYKGEHDSRSLWEHWLPQVAQEEGFVWLEGKTLQLQGIGICGTMGWYDYSSQEPHLSLDDEDYRLLKRFVNHDADYVNWPWSDRAVALYLRKGFATQLALLSHDPNVRQIIVVTHMPIFANAIPHDPENDFWSLLRAYSGNLTLGQLVRQHKKVTHVVSGHIHQPGNWTLVSDYGPIQVHVVGSGKAEPAAVVLAL